MLSNEPWLADLCDTLCEFFFALGLLYAHAMNASWSFCKSSHDVVHLFDPHESFHLHEQCG